MVLLPLFEVMADLGPLESKGLIAFSTCIVFRNVYDTYFCIFTPLFFVAGYHFGCNILYFYFPGEINWYANTFSFLFSLLRTASRSRERTELAAAAAGPGQAVCGFFDFFYFRELFLCRDIFFWRVWIFC